MTRLRFFLGLLGVPMAAQKQETQSTQAIAISQMSLSVPRKPANGDCPVCAMSAFVTRKDEIDNFWKPRGSNESKAIWNVWQWWGGRAMVQCRNCNVVFVIERTDEK